MGLPGTIFAGDLLTWTDSLVPAEATGASAFFRTRIAGAGLAVAGTKVEGVWRFTAAAEQTAEMPSGEWNVQCVATLPDGPFTYRPILRLNVRPSLAFTGTPDQYETRSETELELVDVRAAIQAVYRSLEYRIGTADGGRMVRRADLPWLEARERTLLTRIAAERRAAAGHGRRVLTRFTSN